jgi:concanavalin A-like lectin/glucanase superfamily protein
MRRTIGLCAAGLLASAGCTPDEVQAPVVQAPQSEIEASVAPTSGLIGEWKLDETGGTIAVDSKNGYNATVFGGAAFVAGKLGNALNLNNGTAGTGGKYAQMPSNAALDNVQEGNYTISAWFYPYSIPPNATVVNRYWAIVSKYGAHMGLVYNSEAQFVFRHYLAGTPAVLELAQGTTVRPIGSWYHVAGTVNKAAGISKIYVNGVFEDTGTWDPTLAPRDYGTTPFRIGKTDTEWAADGKVDQVRIYNRELSASEIADLSNETPGSTFRFPVGMTKGTDESSLGMSYTPDGHMTTGSVAGVYSRLQAAKAAGARITLRVTGGNGQFAESATPRTFVLTKWKNAFRDNVGAMPRDTLTKYLADGTLIGHYAIDEPFTDFDNMTPAFLEQMCQYQKESFPAWSAVPCMVRSLNTRLNEESSGVPYQWVDAGWATIANHTIAPYGDDVQAFYQANLEQGSQVGLGTMYSFNLLNGGDLISGCARPSDPAKCAMTAAEVRTMADAIANLGNDQGCGVIGWMLDENPGPERDYFFSQGTYTNNGIQSALQYLNSRVGGLRPGPCDLGG